jgi:hypothetical protein
MIRITSDAMMMRPRCGRCGSPSTRRGELSKKEIEDTIRWLLTHKQQEVRATLRKFRKLPLVKQRQLDRKLLYLVSILDAATRAVPVRKARGRRTH